MVLLVVMMIVNFAKEIAKKGKNFFSFEAKTADSIKGDQDNIYEEQEVKSDTCEDETAIEGLEDKPWYKGFNLKN